MNLHIIFESELKMNSSSKYKMQKCKTSMRKQRRKSLRPYMREEGEGNGTPLQYSCLENPMDGGAWWAVVHGVAKSRTRLSDFFFFFFFLVAFSYSLLSTTVAVNTMYMCFGHFFHFGLYCWLPSRKVIANLYSHCNAWLCSFILREAVLFIFPLSSFLSLDKSSLYLQTLSEAVQSIQF